MEILTIKKACEQEIIIHKSRFLCALAKTYSEEEAQDFIRKRKKLYWDATHNCSAYIVGLNGQLRRSSDDGEPAGTAGVPMLEALRKAGVTNVTAVVTRYFGGIKLGAGGLVRAYTDCVSGALRASGLSKIVTMGTYSFTWPQADVGRVLNILYRGRLFTVENIGYAEEATIELVCPAADLNSVVTWLTIALNTQIELTVLGTKLKEIPVTDS